MVALKDIPPGTEILLDYGVDWRFLQEGKDEESSDSSFVLGVWALEWFLVVVEDKI